MSYLSPEDLKAALPRYRSHKIVQAAKILDVLTLPLRLRLDVLALPLRPGLADNVHRPEEWFQPKALASTVAPAPGWWLVLYEDGYISFSPAKAFEEGYLPVDMPPGGTHWWGRAGAPGEGPAAAAAIVICGAAPHDESLWPCNLTKGHSGEHLFVKPPAAAAAPDGRCFVEFEAIEGNETSRMVCTRPVGHAGAHGRVAQGGFDPMAY